MVNEKELRIGNYIQYSKNGSIKYDTVKSIYYDDDLGTYSIELANRDFNLFHLTVNGMSPIKITEELLSKCGFSQIYGSDPQEPNAMLLYYNSTGDFTIMSTENDRNTFHYETGITVTSVHQLQNLHFSLTGKELDVLL